jgi:hypothetical protein
MKHDALIWAPFFVKITCDEVLMEELLLSKPTKTEGIQGRHGILTERMKSMLLAWQHKWGWRCRFLSL